MPLILPVPQASLRSFFTEVQRYLLEELGKNTLSSADKRLPELINQLSEMISTDCSNVTLVRCLMNAIWELKSYAPQHGKAIYTMFSQYLNQLNSNDLTPLMIAIKSQPLLVEPLLAAIPDELKSTVFPQINKYRGNALMMAARYQPIVIAPLLAATPDELKPAIFQQTTKRGNNALMLAARNQPAAILPLLADMSLQLKSTTLQQTDEEGWNALMLATCNQSDAVIPLLAAIPEELKPTLFQQVTKNGWNALMLAAWNQPTTIKPLLAAIPEELKLSLFQQVNKYGHHVLMLAAYNHPTALDALIAAMPKELTIPKELINYAMTLIMSKAPNEVVKQLFDEEDKAWFDSQLTIMPQLLKDQEFEVILTLLSNGAIAKMGKTFQYLVSYKQQLLDYILSQDEMSRYALLKNIHDNDSDSLLANIFHSKRGFLKPQKTKGVLGLAETEYLRLDQNKAPYLAVSEPSDTATSSTAVIQQKISTSDSLYPILSPSTASSSSSAPIIANDADKPLLPDLLAIDKPVGKNSYATKPLFYLATPLKPSRNSPADFDALMSLAPKIPTTPIDTTPRLIRNASPTIDI